MNEYKSIYAQNISFTQVEIIKFYKVEENKDDL